MGPKSNSWCRDFTANLFSVCSQLSFKLAADCPKFDKAFTLSTRGKVLGIVFDTTSLSWALPREKNEEYLAMVSVMEAARQAQLCYLHGPVHEDI